MSEHPTVTIIGAGISGLTAGKALADYGIDYTCFEAGDTVGGNWAWRNSNGRSSAYRSLHIDTSRTSISFQDWSMPDDFPDFPHHTEVHTYLEGYAGAFGLKDAIRFGCEVERAERLPGGGWRLTVSGEEHLSDVLVVGNGHHWDPRLPEFPGSFDGPTIHSHHYIDVTEPLDLQDKRVLVVGIGNSGVDIASELSRKGAAAETFLSTRSGAWIVPKYILGKPLDEVLRTVPQIPLAWQRRLARILPRIVSGKVEDFGLPTPNHNFLEAHPTVSSEILLRLGSGDAQAKPDVAELEGDSVRFVDGTVEQIDAIVYATGYNISFPFFDDDVLSAPENRLPLFKRMFKPEYDDLVLVGFAQAIPTLFPFIEIQSKLMARYCAGVYRPPDRARMEQVIRADEQLYIGHVADRPRHTQQIDYLHYAHDLNRHEFPEGLARAWDEGPVPLAGRAHRASAAA